MAENEARITAILQMLAADPIKLEGDPSKGYARLVVRERKTQFSSEANADYEQYTLAYAIPLKRSGQVKLDLATDDVKDAPKRFAPLLMASGDRTRVVVTKNAVKTPRALLEWIAKQKASA